MNRLGLDDLLLGTRDSLVFSRYKAIIGGHLRAKGQDSQELEALLGCAILNKLRALGAPMSVPVAAKVSAHEHLGNSRMK